ncbi:GNAT family N-acetyltransferase [Yoonia sp.]|uniref:GNAT family N-acetyltransferase n=1 Tax=Yoonia sp. TaxID=2212373 RepID=UPI003A4D34B1
MTQVSIAPMPPATQNALRGISVSAEQVNFSGQPSEVIDLDDPRIDIHVIHADDRVAGMFRIDRAFHLHHQFAASTIYGLRTFLVDQQLQGRGIAKACCAQLPDYLADHYPTAEAIMLTVNLRNPAARRAYLAGGFIDTGAQYMDGGFGPQHILKLAL